MATRQAHFAVLRVCSACAGAAARKSNVPSALQFSALRQLWSAQPAVKTEEASSTTTTHNAELERVAQQFQRWNSALATLDPKKVAELYAPDGVLLPTVSNKVRTSKEEIVDYFTNFLKLRPQGTINECNVRILSPDTAINSGVYTFDIVRDGLPAKVQARYSFTYKKINGDWYIADHHSSGMPEPVQDKGVAEIRVQFDRWNAALATLDPKKVAELYAPNSVLLPTVSNKVRTTKEEIEDYFKNFLQLRPQGTLDESNVRFLTSDTAINSGVYTFDLVKDGQPTKVQARYSFTYKKIDGDWMIIDHHSSAMPESEENTRREIAAQFQRWNSALATLDPKKVAELYAPNSVLLPTVSNKVRTSKEEIEDYFKNFLQLRPQGKIDEANIRLLAPDTAINSGVYTFDLVKDGQPTKVQARYSFTYKKFGGEWKIIDHHSSGMPEPVSNGSTASQQEEVPEPMAATA